MTRISRRWQPAPEDEAFFAQRARFHLVYRLAGRVSQVVVSRHRGESSGQIGSLLAWAASDIAGAVALRRSPRFGLLPRLIVDVADITHWAGRGDDCDLAVISGVPLSVEAGIRMGPAALVVPLITGAATAVIRRRRNLPSSLFSFRWQVVGVGVGVGLAAYRRSSHKVLLARHEQDLRARLQQAFVSGQNDVAMGADSVVDLLSRTSPLLPPECDDRVVGRLLAAWKQSLAADTMAQTTYLGVALAQWQRRHNALNHALDDDVTVSLDAGSGTVLLSGTQAGWLEAALDGKSLRGSVKVSLLDPEEAAQPDTPRRLLVAGETVVVPANRGKGLTPVDVGPGAFVAGAMWCLDTMTSANSKSARWAVGPMVGAGIGLAAWSNRQVDRDGADAHWRIVLAGIGWSMAQAVAGTATMTRTRAANGMQRYPFLTGVDTLGLILPLYFNEFSTAQQVTVLAGLAAVIGVGLVLLPEPIIWTHLICDLLWCGSQALSIVGLGDGLSDDARRLSDQLAGAEEGAISQAFADGRSFVVLLVSEAGRSVRRSFDAAASTIEPVVAGEIRLRLAEMEARLEQLSARFAPPIGTARS